MLDRYGDAGQAGGGEMAGALEGRNDTATVAALAVLAAISVTVAHEAVGHGGVCLAIGGRLTLLTTSLFRCDAPSFLIDLGGPLNNLAVGLLAAGASILTRTTRSGLTLYLILVAAMAGFWEGGYLVQAMLTRHGDLYFAWTGLVGEASGAVRGLGVAIGAALYLATVVFASRMLAANVADPLKTARIAWFAATVATVAAAMLYRGGLGDNLRDTVLEIGAASLPLLFVVRRGSVPATVRPISRSLSLIGLSAMAWLVFALTMGGGIVA